MHCHLDAAHNNIIIIIIIIIILFISISSPDQAGIEPLIPLTPLWRGCAALLDLTYQRIDPPPKAWFKNPTPILLKKGELSWLTPAFVITAEAIRSCHGLFRSVAQVDPHRRVAWADLWRAPIEAPTQKEPFRPWSYRFHDSKGANRFPKWVESKTWDARKDLQKVQNLWQHASAIKLNYTNPGRCEQFQSPHQWMEFKRQQKTHKWHPQRWPRATSTHFWTNKPKPHICSRKYWPHAPWGKVRKQGPQLIWNPAFEGLRAFFLQLGRHQAAQLQSSLPISDFVCKILPWLFGVVGCWSSCLWGAVGWWWFFWIPLFFGAKNRFRQPKGKIHEHQKTTVVSVGKQQFILESWHGPLVRPATQDKTVNCWVYTLQVEIATPFGHIQCGCTAVEWSLSVKQKANKHPKWIDEKIVEAIPKPRGEPSGWRSTTLRRW